MPDSFPDLLTRHGQPGAASRRAAGPAAARRRDGGGRRRGRDGRVFAAHGYERIKPPLIEFEDGLLSGFGGGHRGPDLPASWTRIPTG